MPDDYYDDGQDSMAPKPDAPEPSDDGDMKPQSALVPKSFFSGKDSLAVGDTETVRVLRLMDDEVEIECVKEGYKSEEPASETSKPTAEPDDMMAY